MTNEGKVHRGVKSTVKQDWAASHLKWWIASTQSNTESNSDLHDLHDVFTAAEWDLHDCVTDQQKVKVFVPVIDAIMILQHGNGYSIQQLSNLRNDLLAAATGSKDASNTALQSRDPVLLEGHMSAVDAAIQFLDHHSCSTVALKELRGALASWANRRKAKVSLKGAPRHGKRYPVRDEMFRASAIVLAQKRPDLYDQIAVRVREHLNVDLARLIENFEGQETGGLTLLRLVATATQTYEREGVGGLNFYLFSYP